MQGTFVLEHSTKNISDVKSLFRSRGVIFSDLQQVYIETMDSSPNQTSTALHLFLSALKILRFLNSLTHDVLVLCKGFESWIVAAKLSFSDV